MGALGYQRKPTEPPKDPARLTRTELIIVLTGAVALVAILAVAFWFCFVRGFAGME